MSQTTIIGNLYPENKHQSGNVYSVGGVASTIMSGTHGYGIGAFIEVYKLSNEEIEVRKVDKLYAENTIAKSRAEQSRAEQSRAEQSRAEQLNDCVKVIGCMDHTLDHTFESANRVYDDNGIAPTVNTCGGGGLQPKVIEIKKVINRQIVAMRDNPSDRNSGIELEQRLEPNSENICNTLTSVQKGNLVLEQEIINPLADNEEAGWHFAQNVYDENSPLIRSVKAGGGSGNTPKIIQVRQATEQGFTNVEIGGVVDLNYPSSQTRRGRAIESGQISPTLTTENTPSVIELGDPDFYNFLYEIDGEIYLIRIRKLTPRECWNLMNFNEGAFEKAKWKKDISYLEGDGIGCNAKLKVVPENQRQENMETCVLCTTKDLQDMEILKTIAKKSVEMQENEKTVNVSIVTEKSEDMEHLGCATSIIKCGTFMGMRFTLMEGKDQNHMVISVQVKMGNTNTEKCMKIITESNLTEIRLYTILTLIKQITESKIFSASTVQANIEGVMQIMTDCEGNILTQLSNLRMEHITELSSNTVLYKQAGNSIVVNVLTAILGQMFEGKEEVYKQ